MLCEPGSRACPRSRVVRSRRRGERHARTRPRVPEATRDQPEPRARRLRAACENSGLVGRRAASLGDLVHQGRSPPSRIQSTTRVKRRCCSASGTLASEGPVARASTSDQLVLVAAEGIDVPSETRSGREATRSRSTPLEAAAPRRVASRTTSSRRVASASICADRMARRKLAVDGSAAIRRPSIAIRSAMAASIPSAATARSIASGIDADPLQSSGVDIGDRYAGKQGLDRRRRRWSDISVSLSPINATASESQRWRSAR